MPLSRPVTKYARRLPPRRWYLEDIQALVELLSSAGGEVTIQAGKRLASDVEALREASAWELADVAVSSYRPVVVVHLGETLSRAHAADPSGVSDAGRRLVDDVAHHFGQRGPWWLVLPPSRREWPFFVLLLVLLVAFVLLGIPWWSWLGGLLIGQACGVVFRAYFGRALVVPRSASDGRSLSRQTAREISVALLVAVAAAVVSWWLARR